MTAPQPSLESLVVDALPAGDRQVLQRGAVLRYITRPLAEVVTDTPQAARRLVDHPVVQGRGDQFWTISEPLRKALLSGWDAADAIRARVAEAGSGLEALYARLAAEATRAAALSELADGFAESLADGDVPRAHDLLRLLDEWPVPDAPEARKLRDRLAPRLRRHSRALRDREATRTYLARGFEDAVWDMLLADDGRWMLHLHAPGGRGKTMFVKNMLGRRCPALDIPVARIDFDHVTQLGIATTEPWRLLVSVAAQLDPQLRDSPFGYLLATYGMFQTVLQPETLPRVAPVTAVPPGGPADELVVDAAREVPERFREQLARAVGDRHVVVALDTVENVLHTEGADLTPVLDAFGDVYHGVAGDAGGRVPGLRLILSGRFDLADTGRERSPGFRRRWVGPQSEVERVTPVGTEVLLGREVAAFEVPGFTEEEARRYLAELGRITDPAMIEAIVARTHDNPMKLALLAEYVARQPDVTAAAIIALPQVELFYLVDRVVDRIADERVQWLLRWGALLPVLTREAVERVIWPALVAFAESQDGYDDTAGDRLPPPTGDVRRWRRPSVAAVREPGAEDRSWTTLLDYAAKSSWVSRVEELPDAVTFHPEVREPLRRLLREGGHPAYDDIHRRSFAYWSAEVESADGAGRTAALRAVLFHAYQPWQGAEHDGDRLFHELLGRNAGSRVERAALAREVLEVSVGSGPSDEVRSLAHLEVAEAAVALAGRSGSPVAESVLSYHLGEIAEPVRAREAGRIEFLRAVLDEAAGRLRECWARLDGLLDPWTPHAQMELVTRWAATRTPPAYALDTAARMVAATDQTQYRYPAGQALTRGLLAAQRWVDALDAAEDAGSATLRAEALIALGEAGAVLTDADATGDWRARARLLRFEPNAALAELGAGTAPATPAQQLLHGLAYAQLDVPTAAVGALAMAASGADPVVATEASLELAAQLTRGGKADVAAAHLQRLAGYADPVVVMRSRLLAARLESGPRAAESLAAAERAAARVPAFPPSLLVDLAITRLAVRGVTAAGLGELRDALAAVQGTGARLLAVRGLADVPAPADPVPPRLRDEVRGVTGTAGGLAGEVPPGERTVPNGPAHLLAAAELERVLDDHDRAAAFLDRLPAGRDDPDGALGRVVADARDRLAVSRLGGLLSRGDDYGVETARPPFGLPPLDDEIPVSRGIVSMPDDAEPLLLGLRTDPVTGGVAVESVSGHTRAGTATPEVDLARGLAELARSPGELLDRMGSALRAIGGLGRADPPRVDLLLADPEAARWPWEAALAGLVRRQSLLPPPTPPPGPAATVLFSILNERKDRGHVADLITSAYRGRATPLPRLFRGSAGLPADGGILHVVADPVQRRGIPALQLSDGDLVTAEAVARVMREGPWLLVLDLALSRSEYDAAEQLTIANAFCWHLVRTAKDVDVLCGMFSAADRMGVLDDLAGGLSRGAPLAEMAGALRQRRDRLPGGRTPWRDFVALSSDHPDRRYRLGGPA